MFDISKVLGAVDQIDDFIKLVSARVSALETKLDGVQIAVAGLAQSVGSVPESVARMNADLHAFAANTRDALAHTTHMLEAITAEAMKAAGESDPRVPAECVAQPNQPQSFEGL